MNPGESAPTTDRSLRTRVHHLCGWRRGRTIAGGAVLVGLVALVLLSIWTPSLLLQGEEPHQRAVIVDRIVDTGIIAILVSAVAGFLYAFWNGGPLLASALPVLPELLGGVAAGGWAIQQDRGFLLAAGAAAATVAVYVAGYRETGRWWPTPSPAFVDGLSLVTGLLVVSAKVLVDLGDDVGTHAVDAVVFGWWLWIPAAALALGAWVVCYRRVGADGQSAVAD